MEIDREVPIDPIDRADYFIESVVDDRVKEALRRAAEMPVGEAGECDGCPRTTDRAYLESMSLWVHGISHIDKACSTNGDGK